MTNCEPANDDARSWRQAGHCECHEIGGLTILMLGPPGAGKSMLAQRLPGLLPPLDAREALSYRRLNHLA